MKFTHDCGLVVYYNRKGNVSRWFGPAVVGQPEWVLNSKRHPVQVIKDFLNKFCARLTQW